MRFKQNERLAAAFLDHDIRRTAAARKPATRRTTTRKPSVRVVGSPPKPRKNTRVTDNFRSLLYDYLEENAIKNLEGKIPQEEYKNSRWMAGRLYDELIKWDRSVRTQEDAVSAIKSNLPGVLKRYVETYAGASALQDEFLSLVEELNKKGRVYFGLVHAVQNEYTGRDAYDLKKELPNMGTAQIKELIAAMKWAKKVKVPS